ncbi:hypothetical protein BY996DRAFT_6432326 [Phakopsora pachyrhizi]|uniref:Uncharacterized protein n=1 Tax=Phakopsora pachyrhizi TaxID=170000 RepID=A0AAV0ANF2_PHAPC|nr:hypothetical protein BY996DRAFT_6432326 [Phakopsora pachyrhizi]CAH7670484.1 hypothetical protein PPACK8108_LOCUS5209 [Phakopsora pachyrhizi]
MPGGSPFILTLQKVFWAVAFISIAFIGALLAALYRSKEKKHPVIWGYLLACWVAAWVALLPFFGSVWDYSIPRPLIRANVAAGPPRVVCNINAVLLAYMWTVIPGFGLAFVAEVMRMLLEAIRIVNQMKDSISKQETSNKRKKQIERKGSETSETGLISIDSSTINESSTYGSDLSSSQGGDIEKGSVSSRLSLRSKIRHKWKRLWTKEHVRYMFSIFPLIAGLPSFWLVFYAQSSMGWKYVHSDPFFCYPPDPQVRRTRAFFLILLLVPATFLGLLAVVLYFVLRIRTGTGRRRIHYPLLMKLSVISILTGISAYLEWYINYRLSDRGILGYVPPMYLISSPLFSSAIFVDRNIIEEWKSWIGLMKKHFLK